MSFHSKYVDEKSVSDFYPGGMSISDRSWQGTNYRYGYNAQEKSLEIDASGNHHTAEFWEVNNASLRRWNVDPVVKAQQSGYSLFGNNSIYYNDLFGNTETNESQNQTVSIPSGGGSITWKTLPNSEGKSNLFSTNSGIIDASRSALFNDISMQRDNATISQTPFNLFTQIQKDITTLNNSKFWTSKAIGFLFDIPFSFANSSSLLLGGKYLNGNVPSEAKAFQDAGVNVMSTLFFSAIGGSGSSSAVKAVEAESSGGLNLFKWGAEETSKSSGWNAGDYFLKLPNKGTPQLNWNANYGALRKEMNLSKPIYDSYRAINGTLIKTDGFLNAERYILESRGWIYSPSKGAFLPPIQ